MKTKMISNAKSEGRLIMNTKSALLIILTLLILVSSAYALQQTVGKVVIYVHPGETNSSFYGLKNEGNETVIVKLRAEGNISDYVQIPESLDLPPGKLVYVFVNATIPANYDFSRGRNITGYVYALLEGSPGQVQINVQTRKTVEIIVLREGETKESVVSQAAEAQGTDISSLFSSNVQIPSSALLLLLIVIIIVIAFFYFRSRKNKPRRR